MKEEYGMMNLEDSTHFVEIGSTNQNFSPFYPREIVPKATQAPLFGLDSLNEKDCTKSHFNKAEEINPASSFTNIDGGILFA